MPTLYSKNKNYFKGPRVLSALDIRIRQHTDGNQTLADVPRHVNTLQDGPENFGYDDFRGKVVNLTNQSTGSWLDTYVQTASVPSIPTDIASAYETTGEKLTNQTEAATVVSLSPNNITAGEPTNVSVSVTNAETGAAVTGATVEIIPLGLSATTNASGEATLSLGEPAPGEYEVSASAEGYTDTTATLTVENDSVPQDPTQRALQIAGKSDSSELTQDDVTATITRFNRGQSVNNIDIKQDDVTAMITLFERN